MQFWFPEEGQRDENKKYMDLLLFGFILLVYFLTLYRTVPGGDSGELIVNAYQLGVAHPPGYPLYTLIGKGFTFLPWGSIAFRVNFASAIFDSAAATLLYRLSMKLNKSRAAGVITAGVFAFSPLVWNYATAAEVFALNNFFGCALIYCGFSYLDRFELKWLYSFALVLSLGSSHHHTLAVFSLPLVLWLLWSTYKKSKKHFQVQVLVRVFCALIVGFLPEVYLPYAASKGSLYSWGDAGTWGGFWTHILRREYGTFQLISQGTSVSFSENASEYIRGLPSHYLVSSILLSILGIVFYSKSAPQKSSRQSAKQTTFPSFHEILRHRALILLTVFVFYLSFLLSLSNLALVTSQNLIILDRLWQLSLIPLAIFAGSGWVFFQSLALRSVPALILNFVAFCFVLVQVVICFSAQNHSQSNVIEEFGKSILRSLPANSILYTQGDMVSGTLFYLQACEGVRPDLRLIERGRLTSSWYWPILDKHYPGLGLSRTTLSAIAPSDLYDQSLRRTMGMGNNYSTDIFVDESPVFKERFEKWPYLFVDWILSKESRPAYAEYRAKTQGIVEDFQLNVDLNKAYPAGSWEDLLIQGFKVNVERLRAFQLKMSQS